MLYRACLGFPLYLALFIFTATAGLASPTDLAQWQNWVLEKHRNIDCPWLMNEGSAHSCVWPGQLTMELKPSGLEFTLVVDVYSKEALIQLPGEDRYWPSQVTLNNEAAPVVRKNGRPYLSLASGHHEIQGHFSWRRKPGHLIVPTDIALISLSEAGHSLPVNRRGGQVIFTSQGIQKEGVERDSLKVEVYRHLVDDVPMRLDTQLKLSVSGKAREVELGQLAWQGTRITSLRSALPARIEKDGNLRIQLQAGEHVVEVSARFTANTSVLQTKRHSPVWPEFEYLGFNSNTDLRQVKLSGAPSIDTSQVPIPARWSELPTYKLTEDTRLLLTTEFRGDHSPLVNQLKVQRELWLDFNGTGFTTLDNISGSMYRDWRLNAAADIKVGRATVAGRPILITEDDGQQGIEIRSPEINLTAISRINSTSSFSAVGWQAQADQFNATLHTPPGWRVLHASGVDNVRGTWISKWDLWDIFLLLITIAATRKLLGVKLAALGGIALIVGYHEPGAPVLLFPVLLLVLALLRVLSGKLKTFASVVGAISSALLVLVIIAYAVSSFRLAIYPSLERHSVGRYDYSAVQDQLASRAAAVTVTKPMALGSPGVASDAERFEEIVVSAQSRTNTPSMYQLDDEDRVQTGPGLPVWLWNTVHLRSSSPMIPQETINLQFSPPVLTSLWRVSSVFLSGIYGLLVIYALVSQFAFRHLPTTRSSVTTASLVIMAAVIGLLTHTPTSLAQAYPEPGLLKELERRLLKPPTCLPDCVALNHGKILASETELTVRFVAYADADIQLPVPSGRNGWRIARISVDGQPNVPARQTAEHLAIRMEKGHHQVELSGPLVGDQATIVFPVPIHNVQAKSEHWTIDGLVEGSMPGLSLSLRAKVKDQNAQVDTLIPDAVEPFVVVHRQFILGKQWRLQTRVTRLAPLAGPISVSVPLLSFEKVLSRSVAIDEGQANLQFSNNQRTISWDSALDPQDELNLRAATADHYLETWRITPSSLWRIQYQGISPVKEGGQSSSLQPLWRPWPGESLTVAVSRPAGVQGQTHTTEEAKLSYTTGTRLQKSTLELSVLSSLGDEYTVALPENAEVLSVHLNEQSMNLPADNQVTVPLQPGKQSLVIAFQQRQTMNWISQTPMVKLPGGATNIEIAFELPRDRWPLYLSGPAIGPAMLYWGVLCVILIGAIALTMLTRRLALPVPVGLAGWLLLGVGLSTVNSYGVIAVAVFFFAMAYRLSLEPKQLSPRNFKALQCLLVVWTVLTVGCVVTAIPLGLLSSPDMKVVGNGSWSHHYNYYQDRAEPGAFPTVLVMSVNLFIYRVVMLAWSLWLATQLIRWANWWWGAYSKGGTWSLVPLDKPEA